MNSRRLEIAIPEKGTRKTWPTYAVSEAQVVAVFKAIHGTPMSRSEKLLAKAFAEKLMQARHDYRVLGGELRITEEDRRRAR